MKTEYVLAEASQKVNAKRVILEKLNEAETKKANTIETIGKGEWALITWIEITGERKRIFAVLTNKWSCTTFKAQCSANSSRWRWRHGNGRWYDQNGTRD